MRVLERFDPMEVPPIDYVVVAALKYRKASSVFEEVSGPTSTQDEQEIDNC